MRHPCARGNGILQLSVIISTYNNVAWLDKVLHGYRRQTHRDFEVIVADDGSGPDTARLIATRARDFPVPLRHVWHADRGYRRQRILNKAIPMAEHDYIVFTDGDCIPRRDLLHVHARLAEPGKFLSGGYCKLGMALSRRIDADDIDSGRCFDTRWLARHEPMRGANRRKLGAGPGMARLLDAITPAGATFNNCNSSAWKSDLLAVNGYDERMQYGGPDRELGERLANLGVRGKQVRHRAVCIHLDHDRGYRTAESLRRNLAIRAHTRAARVTWTPFGIQQGAATLSGHAPSPPREAVSQMRRCRVPSGTRVMEMEQKPCGSHMSS